jgi:DNA ligase (NAD+)
MGPQLIAQLIDGGIVKSLADVLTLDRATLLGLDRFGAKSADNLLAALETAKHTTLPRLLFALGIPGVGTHMADVLANRFGDLDALAQAQEDELSSIQEIGPLSAHGIVTFFSQPTNRRMIDDLRAAGLVLEPLQGGAHSAALSGLRFVFTGALSSMTRSEAGERVTSLGGIVASSVSKSTNYVVLGENAGSKADKAREMDIPVLSESEFLEFLKSYE